jgi:hypothetical protein
MRKESGYSLVSVVQTSQRERRWLRAKQSHLQLRPERHSLKAMLTRSGTRLIHGTNLAPSLINTPELGPICHVHVGHESFVSTESGNMDWTGTPARKAAASGTYHIVEIRFDGDRCPLSLVLTDHLPDHHPAHGCEKIQYRCNGRVQLAAYA